MRIRSFCNGSRQSCDGGNSPKEIFSRVDELKSYRLDVPQVTILADELQKTWTGYSKRNLKKKEELVEAITHLQQ